MPPLDLSIIEAAQSAELKWGIPSSVTLAQYGDESGWGKNIIPGSNNPFNIKALPGQPFVMAMTHEFVNGVRTPVEAAFRAYDTIHDAFDDHGRLLATAEVYAPARALLPSAIAFMEAMAPHYATDPGYAATLKEIMVGDNLLQYDGVTA